jgi:hypothetical protein
MFVVDVMWIERRKSKACSASLIMGVGEGKEVTTNPEISISNSEVS